MGSSLPATITPNASPAGISGIIYGELPPRRKRGPDHNSEKRRDPGLFLRDDPTMMRDPALNLEGGGEEGCAVMWQTSLTWISVGQRRICISAHIHTHQPVKGGCSRSEPQRFGHVVKIFSLSLEREDGEAYVGSRGGVHHKSEPTQSASPQCFFPALLPRALHDMRSVGLGR